MEESYFELLTQQPGLPAKLFDPLEELKLLRRTLDSRLQTSESSVETFFDSPPLQTKIEMQEVAPTPFYETEVVSLEAVMDKIENINNMLTDLQPSRECTEPSPNDIFRGNQRAEKKRRVPALIAQCLNVPQGRILETLNVCLMALGIIGAVFGVLVFSRGWEGDLPLGSWICTSGAAIVILGLGGRFLASHAELSVG